MRTLRTWGLVFLVAVIASGCAVGPTLTPVTGPAGRLQFKGFSILPPRGENWFMDASPINPGDPNWTWDVVVYKKFREKVQRPAEFHSIYVVVSTRSLGDVKFDNRTELLQYLAAEMLEGFKTMKEESMREPKFVFLDAKAYLDKCLGWDCVRHEFKWEVHNPRSFPGFVFIDTVQGFLILHPDSPTFLIRLQYSQRYLRGEQPFSVEAEIEPFFRSLLFTPPR